MKVDLSSRDIELLLLLINESASPDGFTLNDAGVFSFEELALIEKLESALKKCEMIEKTMLDAPSSDTVYH
jgi:hypothetical protein